MNIRSRKSITPVKFRGKRQSPAPSNPSESISVDDQRGNVSVMCRFRPLNAQEQQYDTTICTVFHDQQTVQIIDQQNQQQQNIYNFDYVFRPEMNQKAVYEIAGKQILESVLQGFNGTILAYGQTSSGKTYTMSGPIPFTQESKGIMPRIMTDLFNYIQHGPTDLEFTIKAQYCEIYMEQIYDLLQQNRPILKLHQSKEKGMYLQDIRQHYASNPNEIFNLLKIGSRRRETGSNSMNNTSSRSHAIFTLTIIQQSTSESYGQTSRLHLVDLAGSEKVGKTGACGKRLDEAKIINKSLSTLGHVIHSLTDGVSSHIPYRDSKLTRLLQESLGGNSRTVLIVTCSPSNYNLGETLSTLRFGVRAKSVKNKPVINRELSHNEMKQLLEKAQQTILQQEQRILMCEQALAKNNIALPKVKQAKAQNKRAQCIKQEELQVQLQKERHFIAQHVQRTAVLTAEVETLKQKNTNLIQENDTLNEKFMGSNAKIESLEDQLMDKDEKIEQLENIRKLHEQEISNLQQNQVKFQSKLDQITNKYQISKEKLLQLTFDSDSSISNASFTDVLKENRQTPSNSRKFCSLQRNLEQLTLMYNQLQTQNQIIKTDQQVYEKKLIRKTERVVQLEKQLLAARSHIANYKHRNDCLLEELQEFRDIAPQRRVRRSIKGGETPIELFSPFSIDENKPI